jgi:hypothetical protein
MMFMELIGVRVYSKNNEKNTDISLQRYAHIRFMKEVMHIGSSVHYAVK